MWSKRRVLPLVVLALSGSLLLPACKKGGARFDEGSVVPLNAKCPEVRSAMADLLINVELDKATEVLTREAPNEQVRQSIAVVASAAGDSTKMQEPDVLVAAKDLQNWLNLACRPVIPG